MRLRLPIAICMAMAMAVALAGCGKAPASKPDTPPPQPALWELASADGTVEGWLFGTIHALPDGTQWETPLVRAKLSEADILVVEIAALEDSAAISRVFSQLAQTSGQPPLSKRIPSTDRSLLDAALREANYTDGDFAHVESWAAALMLAQAMRKNETGNGVDLALLGQFGAKPVRELEGAVKQLGIFDRLAERDQRDLLSAVIKEGPGSADKSAELAQSWLAGDMQRIARENQEGLLADPELRAALLVNRNADWVRQITTMLPRSPPIMVAVGAAHMAGPEGLPILLQQRGYRVTRIQ